MEKPPLAGGYTYTQYGVVDEYSPVIDGVAYPTPAPSEEEARAYVEENSDALLVAREVTRYDWKDPGTGILRREVVYGDWEYVSEQEEVPPENSSIPLIPVSKGAILVPWKSKD